MRPEEPVQAPSGIYGRLAGQKNVTVQTAESRTKTRTAAGRTKPSLALLLAEDNPVTQGLLTHLLTQRGHRVDVVDDGEQALKALRSGSYDIALMDFHLPHMDGLQVVATFRSMAGDTTKLPRFIGITADIEGLLVHPNNCEVFDLVIAKPIDIVHLCSVVENFEGYFGWTRDKMADAEMIQPTPAFQADNNGSDSQLSAASRLDAADERRRAKRVKVEGVGTTIITLRNGKEYDCQVLDLSLGGAALQVEVRPDVGERVHVGRTEGRVVRHTNEGIAVEFANAAPPLRRESSR
jgi:CheY-like chemotaxis protein